MFIIKTQFMEVVWLAGFDGVNKKAFPSNFETAQKRFYVFSTAANWVLHSNKHFRNVYTGFLKAKFKFLCA